MGPQTQSIPEPNRERWQPLRSGFVNLYRYDREEFHYENGRLLLRGNNGTGKSRVLALQLPFLLDGEVNPRRLEPDSDPSKKVEWNLLMGRYPERTGYTWLEFGRRERDGQRHYLTLGCGLSAAEGQPGVRQWFFITSQRIGRNLELVSESKQVLGKGRLREKIGSAGQVFEAAGPYRRAVNEALFHLDEYRYATLVNLLIQLRRPQLTRRLEEHELSETLSEALPPVSATVIGDLADAFRNLQSDRTELGFTKAALDAVEQFLTVYRRYAQIAAKRRADRVLAAHYEYEAGMKEILAAEAECDRSLAELGRLKAEMQRLALEEHALEAEITAFQQSPHMKDAHAFEHAHRQAVERREDANCAAAELADATRTREACVEEHVKLRAKLEQSQFRLAAAADAAREAASYGGLHETHRECAGALDLYTADESALRHARENIERAIDTQMDKFEHASSLNERVASARNQLQRAVAGRDQLAGLLADACEQLNTARGEHRSAITAFLTAASDWTAALTELPLPFDDAFLSSVTEWCDKPHGSNPFIIASRRAVEELTLNSAESQAYFKQLEKAQNEELSRLESEYQGLVIDECLNEDEAHHARILELKEAIADAETRLDPIIDSIEELNRREKILRSEAHGAPLDDSVRLTYDYSVAIARHVEGLRSRVAEAEEYVAEKELQVEQATKQRDEAVADLGIIKWVNDLNALKDGIAQYRLALCSLWSAAECFHDVRVASECAWGDVERTTAREARQKEISNQFERRAVASEIARDAAGQTVDTDFDDIVQRIARARQRLDQLRLEEAETRRRYHDTEVAVTRVDERLRSRSELLNGQTDRRNSAASSLSTFASTGLLQLAVPGIANADALKTSTSRTVEVAFELAARLASVDSEDSAWDHHQKSVPSQFNTLMQALSALGCQSAATFRDDLFVATAMFAGQERAMDELRQILLGDATDRQMLLHAREKEILENHLVGKVSAHLRELLQGAEEQVRQMNVELESRPMSTGMKLRFVWRPAENGPSGLTDARRRLTQTGAPWSLAERQALGMFLHQQIQAVCSDAEGASWQELLGAALDYRKWHWFGVERYQDGVWKRLTRRTHGTGSGGEKAIALTLPHFAAAAAFYRTADSLAPRLILLDEAFVGIDADMRAKCMGLIHTFDLDFLMTSEREWGCYQTLPGIAIYQLSTRPGIDAIGLTRWVWNGRQRGLHHNVNVELKSNESDYETGETTELVALESPQN